MKGNGQDIQELTRIEAYLLSEKAGHPSHMHDYFWSQAEAIVRQRIAIVETAVKASREKAPKTTKVAKGKAKPTAPKAKKTPDAQLPLVDVIAAAKPVADAPKPKAVSSTKKKVTPPVKAVTKKASKPK